MPRPLHPRVKSSQALSSHRVVADQCMVRVQAEELGVLLSRYDLRSHVNLIPWNPVDDSPYERPSRNAVRAFADVLETSHRIPTSIRITRGAHRTRLLRKPQAHAPAQIRLESRQSTRLRTFSRSKRERKQDIRQQLSGCRTCARARHAVWGLGFLGW